jgi:hypothetical protein
MEEFDQVALALGEMVPRKVGVRTTGIDDIEKFDAAQKYFERTRGGQRAWWFFRPSSEVP